MRFHRCVSTGLQRFNALTPALWSFVSRAGDYFRFAGLKLLNTHQEATGTQAGRKITLLDATWYKF